LKAEIICVGSELLLGEIINTNAVYISKRLSELGIGCYYQTTVGDNPVRITNVLKDALKRSDLIIITGGLGPTDDDLTVQTIADYFNEPMEEDPQEAQKLKNFFEKLNLFMPESNFKQVLKPRCARFLNNPVGTAPALLWELKQSDYSFLNSDKIIMCFPGVPNELYGIWEESVNDYLSQYSEGVILNRHVKFANLPESQLAEKVRDLLDNSNPTVAPYVTKGEAYLRVSAKARTKQEAEAMINKVQEEIIKRTGEYFYGIDDEALEDVIGKLLTEKNLTVAVAESCTGGLISSRLTDVSGSSAYVTLNVVTYANDAKAKLLGVKQETLLKYGAVSEQTAKEMAEGIKSLSGADFGLSITGIAGPSGGSKEKPVGLAYIGLADKNDVNVYKILVSSKYNRADIKYRFSQKALDILRKAILTLD